MNLDQLRASDPWTWERTMISTGVSARHRRSSARQWTAQVHRKRRAAERDATPLSTALTEASDDITKGDPAMSIMLAQPSDEKNPTRSESPGASATIRRPVGTHWYVDNVFGPGYCAACSTPRENRRHIPRVA